MSFLVPRKPSIGVRYDIIRALTEPQPVYDDRGNVIGHTEPLVVLTPAQVLEILEFGT